MIFSYLRSFVDVVFWITQATCISNEDTIKGNVNVICQFSCVNGCVRTITRLYAMARRLLDTDGDMCFSIFTLLSPARQSIIPNFKKQRDLNFCVLDDLR